MTANITVNGNSQQDMPLWLRVPFFGTFMAIGLWVFYLMVGHEYLAVYLARTWEPARCTIESIRIDKKTAEDGTVTGSVETSYAYAFDGKRFVGDSYAPHRSYRKDLSGLRSFVDGHPAGSETACFVDPADPSRSALTRDYPPLFLPGFAPLIFFFAGLFGFIATAPSSKLSHIHPGAGHIGGVVIQEARSPLKVFFGTLLVALVWNGIVVAGGYASWEAWQGGDTDAWVGLVVSGCFGLIGLFVLASVPFAFLQIFSPRAIITMDRPNPVPGESVTFSWRFFGPVHRIAKLEINLELISISAPRDRRADVAAENRSILGDTIIKLPVVSSDSQSIIGRGERPVRLPSADEIPVERDKEKLGWRLSVRGHIPNYPDYVALVDVPIRGDADSQKSKKDERKSED